MKYFITGLIIAVSFMSCTTPESVTDGEDSPASDASPEWFDNRIASSSDTTSFYGYSLAAASDSAEAVNISTEMALQNLRFEIDRFAEGIREKAEETTGAARYQSGEFIFSLRDKIQSLDLSDASITRHHKSNSEGVHHHFSRAELPRDEVKALISSAVSDNAFLEEL
ncbi:MAG: hypothetical protein WD604_01420 [Balneolaceae bacterium]